MDKYEREAFEEAFSNSALPLIREGIPLGKGVMAAIWSEASKFYKQKIQDIDNLLRPNNPEQANANDMMIDLEELLREHRAYAEHIELLVERLETTEELASQINTHWIPANEALSEKIKELESKRIDTPILDLEAHTTDLGSQREAITNRNTPDFVQVGWCLTDVNGNPSELVYGPGIEENPQDSRKVLTLYAKLSDLKEART